MSARGHFASITGRLMSFLTTGMSASPVSRNCFSAFFAFFSSTKSYSFWSVAIASSTRSGSAKSSARSMSWAAISSRLVFSRCSRGCSSHPTHVAANPFSPILLRESSIWSYARGIHVSSIHRQKVDVDADCSGSSEPTGNAVILPSRIAFIAYAIRVFARTS